MLGGALSWALRHRHPALWLRMIFARCGALIAAGFAQVGNGALAASSWS